MFELKILLRDRLIGRSTFTIDEVRIGRSSDLELVVLGDHSEVVSGSHARLFRRGAIINPGSRDALALNTTNGRERQ